MDVVVFVLIGFVALFGLITILSSFFTVSNMYAAIIERFGRFDRVAYAGLSWKMPFVERIAAKVSLQLTELRLSLETKTKDNVFVTIPVSVQFQRIKDKVADSWYKLANEQAQIGSYVENAILGHIPSLTLDEAFSSQASIAAAVKDQLDEVMEGYGFHIVKVLITDITPAQKVKDAMNDINAAQREQVAAQARGEAEKILKVKQAEAEAESKALQGQGIANQRKAIIAGLTESVEGFQQAVKGASAESVLQLVVLTQYLDTLKEIGANARTNTILIPHSPGGLADFASQIRDSLAVGNLMTERAGEATAENARSAAAGQ
jgi:regulator of protease activity HflC (stomatin/prohibitin superfamily)